MMRHFKQPSLRRCQCGDDLPGHCPGVDQCPYATHDSEEDAEMLDAFDRWQADARDRARDDAMTERLSSHNARKI